MRTLLVRLGALMMTAAGAAYGDGEAPARHELGLTLGNLISQTRSGPGVQLETGSGIALQANYGYRLLGGARMALYGEAHLLANPQRVTESTAGSLTRDVATLFVTPGLRLKFFGGSRISPYVAAGGGWALFEHSTTTLAGNPNTAPRDVSHGVFDYGGGVDVRLWRFVSLRGEVRDFYSGSPSYQTAALSGGQHNPVAGGGFVLNFGRRE